MAGVAVNGAGSVPPTGSNAGGIDDQGVAFPVANRVALI
jgi:hypothetical protein